MKICQILFIIFDIDIVIMLIYNDNIIAKCIDEFIDTKTSILFSLTSKHNYKLVYDRKTWLDFTCISIDSEHIKSKYDVKLYDIYINIINRFKRLRKIVITNHNLCYNILSKLLLYILSNKNIDMLDLSGVYIDDDIAKVIAYCNKKIDIINITDIFFSMNNIQNMFQVIGTYDILLDYCNNLYCDYTCVTWKLDNVYSLLCNEYKIYMSPLFRCGQEPFRFCLCLYINLDRDQCSLYIKYCSYKTIHIESSKTVFRFILFNNEGKIISNKRNEYYPKNNDYFSIYPYDLGCYDLIDMDTFRNICVDTIYIKAHIFVNNYITQQPITNNHIKNKKKIPGKSIENFGSLLTKDTHPITKTKLDVEFINTG